MSVRCGSGVRVARAGAESRDLTPESQRFVPPAPGPLVLPGYLVTCTQSTEVRLAVPDPVPVRCRSQRHTPPRVSGYTSRGVVAKVLPFRSKFAIVAKVLPSVTLEQICKTRAVPVRKSAKAPPAPVCCKSAYVRLPLPLPTVRPSARSVLSPRPSYLPTPRLRPRPDHRLVLAAAARAPARSASRMSSARAAAGRAPDRLAPRAECEARRQPVYLDWRARRRRQGKFAKARSRMARKFAKARPRERPIRFAKASRLPKPYPPTSHDTHGSWQTHCTRKKDQMYHTSRYDSDVTT